jgi:predicted acylesterase/phospholipase RssA
MNIYAIPISGGDFPHQLGYLSLLSSSSSNPDLVLGTSGGNIVSYIGLAASWNKFSILRVANKLSSSSLIKSWWGLGYLPSYVIGFFKGSLYDINPEFITIFQNFFTSQTIKSTEVWTGTYNKTKGQTHLFCNLSEEESKLAKYHTKNELLNCEDPTYCNGDTTLLAQATIASASIPTVFPPQMINGQAHVDGGDSFSSPLTPLQDPLKQIIKNKPVHITYFSSSNVKTAKETTGTNILSNGKLAVQGLIRSLNLQDRKTGLDLLRDGNRPILFKEGNISEDQFSSFQKKRSSYFRTFVEFYPLIDEQIDIANFTSQQVIELMNKSMKNIGFRLWYIEASSELEIKFANKTYKKNWFDKL